MTQDRWRRAVVGQNRDHHLVDGEPMYAARFDRVLPFHAPGFAPVRCGTDAWHIDAKGNAAYEARFRQTFGFYEDLAAVEDDLGWCHIHPIGVSVYGERYAWCGNFQEGRCAVRGHDGRYFHITPDGKRLYAESWKYAGDYREGIAVVQADDGRSTHVDGRGRLVHERWFRDLDVLHKGYARARDVDGWHHVDREGQAAYERRFAMVEPFYNGQARVERLDGALEVIDETGRAMLELRGLDRVERIPPRR
jgi:hypothetical protein